MMDDTEFSEWHEKYVEGVGCLPESLTDEQMVIICHSLRQLWSYEIKRILEHEDFKPHHIDLILQQRLLGRSHIIFDTIATLTPEQIGFGLSHGEHHTRVSAYRHPKCTEEQKVKYHLMWGDE